MRSLQLFPRHYLRRLPTVPESADRLRTDWATSAVAHQVTLRGTERQRAVPLHSTPLMSPFARAKAPLGVFSHDSCLARVRIPRAHMSQKYINRLTSHQPSRPKRNGWFTRCRHFCRSERYSQIEACHLEITAGSYY